MNELFYIRTENRYVVINEPWVDSAGNQYPTGWYTGVTQEWLDSMQLEPVIEVDYPYGVDEHKYMITCELIENRRIWKATPYATNLDDEKEKKVIEMKKRTEEYINTQMPDWRLNRWKSYYALSKKVKQFGYSSLDSDLFVEGLNAEELEAYRDEHGLERQEYNAFPDPWETHADCEQYVPLALKWVVDCIKAHSAYLAQILTATSITELQALPDIQYPNWPLT